MTAAPEGAVPANGEALSAATEQGLRDRMSAIHLHSAARAVPRQATPWSTLLVRGEVR